MPKATVAHDVDDSFLEICRDAGAARQTEAIAKHGVADIERRQRCEDMAADIAGDMRLANRTLGDLDGAESRPLGTADAEARRAGGYRRAEKARRPLLPQPNLFRCSLPPSRITVRPDKREIMCQALEQDLAGIFAGRRQAALPMQDR